MVDKEQNIIRPSKRLVSYFFREDTCKGGFTKNMEVAAAKLIGAGLAMIGTIGAGLGIGVLVNGAVQGVARNPDASGTVLTNMILGIAFAEAVAIYCLVVALLILFVG
jgi:ATP synthase F0 subunit c